MTVNHDVTGSSPVGGAKKKKPSKWMVFSFFAFHWFQLIISRFAIIRTTTERAKSVVCMRARPVDDAASITEGQRSKSLVTHRHGQRFWVPQPSPKPNPDNISLGSFLFKADYWLISPSEFCFAKPTSLVRGRFYGRTVKPLRFEPSWGSH